MVTNCQQYFLEFNKILPNEQCGFKKHRSTTDHLTRLSDDICKAIQKHQKAIAVFIDYNKAFDRLDSLILIHKLQAIGLSGNIY